MIVVVVIVVVMLVLFFYRNIGDLDCCGCGTMILVVVIKMVGVIPCRGEPIL